MYAVMLRRPFDMESRSDWMIRFGVRTNSILLALLERLLGYCFLGQYPALMDSRRGRISNTLQENVDDGDNWDKNDDANNETHGMKTAKAIMDCCGKGVSRSPRPIKSRVPGG